MFVANMLLDTLNAPNAYRSRLENGHDAPIKKEEENTSLDKSAWCEWWGTNGIYVCATSSSAVICVYPFYHSVVPLTFYTFILSVRCAEEHVLVLSASHDLMIMIFRNWYAHSLRLHDAATTAADDELIHGGKSIRCSSVKLVWKLAPISQRN